MEEQGARMHADDTNYTAIKNGVVVVSGTGPAIRVDCNRLVIRDGPLEKKPLLLTRAEATRKLRHVIVTGHAGGFVTFDALRWLRDTGVAFSQLDWDGSIVIASGPRGVDQPALRRAQALVCSGVTPNTAVAITREILLVKLKGQAAIAALMGSAAVSTAIDKLAAGIVHEVEGRRLLSWESRAASVYWKLWRDVPVRFARRNPQRLGPNGRWRPGRSEQWLTFGQRASLLTGEPYRATTPGNALLNYLYAVLEAEMTVALLAVGLDPSIGMFHADLDRRSSLALDAIEAVRPHVDYWLLAYLAASAFANRDFTEVSDGEVRLTHPLNTQLAHTAALWRTVCEPVANWLAQSFGRAGGTGAVLAGNRKINAVQTMPSKLLGHSRGAGPLTPLPAFSGPPRGRMPMPLQGTLKDKPVPLACWECGKALVGKRRRFCSNECARAFPLDHLSGRVEGPALPMTAAADGKRQ
jgi:CRISPR-associated endonuclease Cas1